MPAYSFQRQFAQPIIDGTKGGTIRAPRRISPTTGNHRRAEVGGHAWPGETLYLFTGMRTKQCRKIAEKTCRALFQKAVMSGQVSKPSKRANRCSPRTLQMTRLPTMI